MCAGAIHWAGLVRVVAGARADDAEAIGFVEGPLGFDVAAFLRRGLCHANTVLAVNPAVVATMFAVAGCIPVTRPLFAGTVLPMVTSWPPVPPVQAKDRCSGR